MNRHVSVVRLSFGCDVKAQTSNLGKQTSVRPRSWGLSDEEGYRFQCSMVEGMLLTRPGMGKSAREAVCIIVCV